MPRTRLAGRIAGARWPVAAVGVLALGPALGCLAGPVRADGRSLVVGRVSQAAGRELKALGPLSRLLGDEVRDLGLDGAEVVVLEEPALVEGLRSGRIDLALEGPARSARLVRAGVALPLARVAIGGEDECRGVVVAREGGAAEGRPTAVPDPDGLGGPPPAAVGSGGAIVASGQSPLELLRSGEADRALVCERDLAGDGAAGLVVIEHGRPLPRALLLGRVGLDPALSERLVGLLLRLPRDPAEAAWMGVAHGITGFTPVTGADVGLLHDLAAPAVTASEP